MRRLACLAALSVSGCTLLPNTVRTEALHISHFSQHFGDRRTNIGCESLEVVARWSARGAYFDLGEGVNISPADGQVCNGGLCGPREMTTLAVGYEWSVK